MGPREESGDSGASADRHLVAEGVAGPEVGGGSGGWELGGCQVECHDGGRGGAVDTNGESDGVGVVTSIDDSSPDQVGAPHADSDVNKARAVTEESGIAHSGIDNGDVGAEG